MEYDHTKYPMIWKRVSRQGYCFTARIPCRIVGRTSKRIKIAALLVNGAEKNHLVEREILEHSPCECFAQCRAIDRALVAAAIEASVESRTGEKST